MNKEINYPVKYAVLELKEKGGYLDRYENITKGFIPSKCYVVENNIIYNSDGSYKVFYKVVFPFQDIKGFKISLGNIGDATTPKYDACEKVYPVNIVTDLFDTYESAKIAAEEKNEEHRNNLMFKVPAPIYLGLSYEDYKHKFENGLEICYMFEQLVQLATENMEISEDLTIDKVKILKPVKNK